MLMSAVEDATKLLSLMTREEKARLLQIVVDEIGVSFPGIERRKGVSGGEACVARTRIPVWLLEQSRRLGSSEADLLRAYPTLRSDDLANAWAYALAHPEEIAGQIRDNEAA